MELTQTFQLLAIVFGGILFLLWNFVFKPKIDKWNDRAGLVESFTGFHESLGLLSFHHKKVSGVLIGIGIIFGVLSVLVS